MTTNYKRATIELRERRPRKRTRNESVAILFLCSASAVGRADDGPHRQFFSQHPFDPARLDSRGYPCVPCGERLPRRTAKSRACSFDMKFAVIQFPGSNCDQDCVAGINSIEGLQADYVWHKETSLRDYDAIVLPGGFAYGDYLRCGAIARFSPIMKAVISDARTGKLVLGTCNGFQVLCEAGLLPGALVRNRSLRFVCEMVTLRLEVPDSPFTHGCPEGTVLRMPIAHGEGCYFADAQTLHDLNHNRQVIMRYADDRGRVVPEANPNGSIENIAGICNREGNVFGLMPHPDRACDARLGSADGAKIFQSMMQTIEAAHVRAA